jgi:hypothetical protein
MRDRKIYSISEGKLSKTYYPDSTTDEPKFNEEKHIHTDKSLQASHAKPNLMYNLSLYRKNYKRN